MEINRISVFDLNETDCARTADAIREYYGQRGVLTNIIRFTDLQSFACDFKDKMDAGTMYDMVFVGVDGMMGLEAARNIRELSEHWPMFIVSKVYDFGLEAFRLCALDYLIKPALPASIGRAVQRIGMRCMPGSGNTKKTGLLTMGCYGEAPGHI